MREKVWQTATPFFVRLSPEVSPGGQSLWRHFLVWDQGDSPSGPIYLFTEAGQGVIMKAPRKLRKKDLADERKESS